MPRSTTSQIPADRKLAEGATKHFGAAPLLIEGKKYTKGDIVAVLQERIDADEAVVAARAVLQRRLEEARAKHQASDALVAAVRKSVHAMYGRQVVELLDFGLTPPKVRRELTSDEKAAAAAKAKATREARHTMGKRQKAKIKGELPPALLVTEQPGAVRAPAPPLGIAGVGANGGPNSGANGAPPRA